MTAGREIKVPAVAPFNPDTKPAGGSRRGDITIQVSKEESALRATRADGTLVFYAPVSSGSVHDPLPPGDFKVDRRRLAPGVPLQPGSVLGREGDRRRRRRSRPAPTTRSASSGFDLNLEHYGLHGTPEPGNVGHTESHGCVRLTNWDAARVASLVKPGTPGAFQ